MGIYLPANSVMEFPSVWCGSLTTVAYLSKWNVYVYAKRRCLCSKGAPSVCNNNTVIIDIALHININWFNVAWGKKQEYSSTSSAIIIDRYNSISKKWHAIYHLMAIVYTTKRYAISEILFQEQRYSVFMIISDFLGQLRSLCRVFIMGPIQFSFCNVFAAVLLQLLWT